MRQVSSSTTSATIGIRTLTLRSAGAPPAHLPPPSRRSAGTEMLCISPPLSRPLVPIWATLNPVVQEGCPVVAHTKRIRALAFSPCGRKFATGGGDGAVILWNTQTGEQSLSVRT